MRRFITTQAVGVLLALTYFFQTSCNKISDFRVSSQLNPPSLVSEKFLETTPNTHPVVKKVVERIRALESEKPFLEYFVSERGYAIWDRSIVMATGNSALRGPSNDYSLLIPIMKADTLAVTGVIACRVEDDSVFYQLFDGRDYALYDSNPSLYNLSGQEVSLLTMVVDKHFFPARSRYQIIDSTSFVFGPKKARLIQIDSVNFDVSSASRTSVVSLTVCYTAWISSGWVVGCEPGQPNCNQYTEVTTCITYHIEIDNPGMGDDPPIPPVGGILVGGGSGGGSDPCKVFPGTESGCGGGGNTSWEPEAVELDFVFDQISYDVQDPCILAALDAIEEVGMEALVAGFYNVSMADLENRLSISFVQVSGLSVPGRTVKTSPDVYQIQLNPSFFQPGNVSIEFWGQIIIHELLHVFVMEEYLYIENLPSLQHWLMLRNFIDNMKQTLISAFGVSSHDALHLALDGMAELAPGGNQYEDFLDLNFNTNLSNIIDVVSLYTTGTGGTKCN